MKSFLVLLLILTLGVGTIKADPVSDFLNRYELFVDGVAALNSNEVDSETMDSLKVVYHALTEEYKTYKKQMTQIQLENYYNMKAKYQKTMAVLKTKRGAKAVSGWVKGIVGKKE